MDDTARSIVAIGASAGGIDPLIKVVAALPSEFPAAVLVVVHIGTSKSVLPRILAQSGVLPASHAVDGERLRAGHIYVAPPDYHLIVTDAHLALSHGAKENHSRPAIDPLFRSAARAYGTHVVGVILSGALSDGTSGLLTIKSHGGRTLVQDPEEATVTGMPQSAVRMRAADRVLPAREIGFELQQIVAEHNSTRDRSLMGDPREPEHTIIHRDFVDQTADRRDGQLTMFTCPDCGGSLWQMDAGASLHFRCHVGHAWSPESLLGNKSEELEVALWASVRLLAERATLSRQVAKRLREHGDEYRAEGADAQAGVDERHSAAIRAILSEPILIGEEID